VKGPIISFFKGRALFFSVAFSLSQKKKQTRKEQRWQREEKLHAFKKTMDDGK
jgi:hypothetical protein